MGKYIQHKEPKRLFKNIKLKTNQFIEPNIGEMVAFAVYFTNSVISYKTGKEQMKMILKEVLKEATVIMAFGSADDIFASLGKYFPKFVEQRRKNKIPAMAIIPDSARARERKKLGPKHLRQTKIISPKYEHHGMIFLWDKKIAMFSLKEELVALVIESEELAQTQTAMFEFMWETGEFVE